MKRDIPWLLILSPALLLACGEKDEDGDDGVSASDICIDEDLGSSIEFDLASADTEGDDYHLDSCDDQDIETGGEDWGWTWTAPATGGYTFNTAGSDFDTVLAIHSGGCGDPLLACNDDASFDIETSEVYVELAEGDQLVIVVDGANEYEDGDIELHVLQDILAE